MGSWNEGEGERERSLLSSSWQGSGAWPSKTGCIGSAWGHPQTGLQTQDHQVHNYNVLLMFDCLSTSLSVGLSTTLSVCLSVHLSVCLFLQQRDKPDRLIVSVCLTCYLLSLRALKTSSRGRAQKVVAIQRRLSTGSLQQTTPTRGRGRGRGRGKGSRSVGSTPQASSSSPSASATPLRVAVVQDHEARPAAVWFVVVVVVYCCCVLLTV